MSYTATLAGVRRLERQQERDAAHAMPSRWYDFLVSPTCPPSKQLYIRGGIPSPSPYWGTIMTGTYIPAWTCDFENEDETQMDLVFSSANYYLPIILCYYYDFLASYPFYGQDYLDGGDPVFDNVIGTEVATSIQAEEQIDAWMNGVTKWFRELLPLVGVVFKNNGQTAVSYAIEPVDSVNRGRSYLYRDLRARHDIFG